MFALSFCSFIGYSILYILRDLSTHFVSMNAVQAKDRLYGQLVANLKNMSRAIGQTADLFEQLQADLDAMRVLAGTHAAQWDCTI
jgi:hypothetical protein